MANIKVMTILGTRPEIIRLSRVLAMLDQYTDHLLVHTGQNYDYELNEIFFNELDIRKPDIFLNVDPSSLGKTLGNILMSIENVFLEEQPDAVLILGDTNSSIAGVMAKRMKIPLYHMEAGNRSFDANVPEEVNRKILDSISDINLVYTEHARRHLLSEGIPHRKIYLTGSPMNEVLNYYKKDIKNSSVLEKLNLIKHGYFLVSMHREENVDNNKKLTLLLDAIEKLTEHFNIPAIVSTHPRTKKRLEAMKVDMNSQQIKYCEPFGFIDYNNLQINAFCVLSDSGTITEESAILGFSAVTIRNSMERPEGLDCGSIIISGLDPEVIMNSVITVTEQNKQGGTVSIPHEYTIENVSQRVVNLIIGTSKLVHMWNGVDLHDYDIKKNRT